MRALRQLLTSMIDYAGLFPPAQLPLPEVVANYAAYVNDPASWMLARLIVPAARLAEFQQVANNIWEEESAATGAATSAATSAAVAPAAWKISALLPKPDDAAKLTAAIESIQDLNRSHRDNPFLTSVDTVEVAVEQPGRIAELAELLPADLNVFMEIPLTDLAAAFAELAEQRMKRPSLFAKIRTGGVTPDLIPSVEQVADFMGLAKDSGVGFKATAGLHHPVRGRYPLTYEADSVEGIMHGFLNVFVAAALTQADQIERGTLVELLSCQEPKQFNFTDDAVFWRDFQLSSEGIRDCRRQFAISFGSCSFREPIGDLTRGGWLPKGVTPTP